MARVTSQKTRQAILVTGDPVDPNDLPEKLQLFNELGDPLMIGGGYARREKDYNTPILTSGTIDTDEFELFPSARLYKIKTNRPARVRMYPTPEQRDADLYRGIGVKPSGNHGRLLEVVTVPTVLELILSPAVDITSVDPFDSLFYMSVTNLDSGSGAVIVTFSYFRTE